MKKRVLKLATSLATAGMLAMTGTVVVPANGEIVPAMTTETVEYTMPGNVDINGCDIDVLAVIYDVEDLVSYSI